MNLRKNFFGILLSVGLIAVVTVGSFEREEEVIYLKSEPIDTHIYLTREDFEKLYTLRPEERRTSSRIVELTQQEALLIMQIARTEGGETLIGQLWVMRVLINRIKSDRPDFKNINTLHDAMYQSGQFEVVTSGAYKRAKLNENSHLALAALEGGWDETDGALWFEASTNTENSWHRRNLTFVAEIEGQRYYK